MFGERTRTRGPITSRRGLLRAGGAGLLVAAAAGCDALSTNPAGEGGGGGGGADGGGGAPEKGTEPAAGQGKEAPALAARVKAGDLPPVEERLPDKPMVVTPVEGPGRYGGTWHSWMQGLGATYVFDVEIGYDPLVRWDPTWKKVIPNVAESWEVGGAGRTYTFHLRAGTKWSDGEPFTADDLVFAFDDVLLNTEISPVPSTEIAPEGRPGTIEKVDDATVRYTFPTPHGLFLHSLANGGGNSMLMPSHYLKKFHKKYNPDVHDLAKKEGFSTWVELFGSKNDGTFQNPDYPVLNAWVVKDPVAKGGQGSYERNPYYWKVDTKGRQLPYIDEVTYPLIDKTEAALLKTLNGDIDFNHPTYTGGVCLLQNKPVLARSREKGDYAFVDSIYETMNWMVIGVNLNHKDPDMRKMFQTKDFRIGLSHAINRKDVRDSVYQRQGEAWQAAPRKESQFYDERFAKQYTEYDVARANDYLDRAGYGQRDSAGFRTRPDGKRVAFLVEVVTEQPDQINSLELIARDWKAVGIDAQVRAEPRSLFTDRIRTGANQHDVCVWTGDGGYGDELTAPIWYLPVTWCFASRWTDWYNSRGKEGEEPSAPARKQLELYDQLKASIDEKRRADLFRQILDIAREEFWCIGTVLSTGAYGTVKNTFHNVPKSIPAAWNYPSPGPTRPEQYYTTSS